MTNLSTSLGVALIVLALPLPALAQDKYRVTADEKAACQGDAAKLCSNAYPDEDALLTCMRSNVGRLTEGCRATFVAGLRKRGLQ